MFSSFERFKTLSLNASAAKSSISDHIMKGLTWSGIYEYKLNSTNICLSKRALTTFLKLGPLTSVRLENSCALDTVKPGGLGSLCL